MNDREQPTKYITILRGVYNRLENKVEQLEKALDKACERLEESCPVDQELIEDLDCDNCKDTYKECWKKYFMEEVLKNG